MSTPRNQDRRALTPSPKAAPSAEAHAGTAEAGPEAVLDLTVIIPTLGRPLLRQGITRLLEGTHWPYEVVVVHQGTEPGVRQWLATASARGLRIRYIQSADRGKSAGVNRGIRAASTPFVAVIDDDCFVARDWVARVAGELRANPGRIVTGRVCAAGTEPVLAVNTSRTRSVQSRPRLKSDVLCGGNLGMARAVLARTGLFDETLAAAEDCEFAYRALRAGVRIEFVPEIVVEHWGWRTPAQRVEQYRWYGRNHGAFYGKYLRRGDLFIAARLVRHVARSMLSLGLAILRRDGERMVADRVHVLNLAIGVVQGCRSRSRVPALDSETSRIGAG